MSSKNGVKMTMRSTIQVSRLESIHVTDELFGGYVRRVADTILPYQWNVLNDRVDGIEKSHCIDNFKIAAGEMQGQHKGPVFCDTDAYKWLEAASYCIKSGSGQDFIQMADELIDLIGRAQQKDGYINTYYTIAHPESRWTNLTEGHELYNAGYLIEAAIAYYQATGKDALLRIACSFADLICETFGAEQGKCKGYPGHQEIELALIKLYHVTDQMRYLTLAKFFIDERGGKPNYFLEEIDSRGGECIFPEFRGYDVEYAQSHMPPIEQTTAEGHAVRALYMYSAMADLAREFDDEELKKTCKTLWDNITKRRMHITGGVGSSGTLERFTVDYDLPNDSTYCESCASIGLMMFGQRMAAITRDASYYDVVEQALCNTVLAGIAATGDRYFYVNPLEVWPENCKASTAMAHVKPVRQPWFTVACCPPNIARTLASLGQYIYSQDEKSLYINQFISSNISTDISGVERTVTMESTHMQDGRVQITVSSSQAYPFTVRVRIPSYVHNPVFDLDGVSISPVIENGYAVLAVSLAQPQTFTLQFELAPRFVAANENVRANMGKVAVVKGPYVYCLEEIDNGPNLASVYVSPLTKIIEDKPIDALPGLLPALSYEGKRIVKTIEQPDALYGAPSFQSKAVQLKAVPYCLWCNRTPGEMLVWQKAAL